MVAPLGVKHLECYERTECYKIEHLRAPGLTKCYTL